MYVLYNIQGNVLLIKLMRKLYQILYNVGRLTDAPVRRAFSFQGDTWAVGVSLSGHVTVLRCGMLQCIEKDSVFFGIGCVGIVPMGVW